MRILKQTQSQINYGFATESQTEGDSIVGRIHSILIQFMHHNRPTVIAVFPKEAQSSSGKIREWAVLNEGFTCNRELRRIPFHELLTEIQISTILQHFTYKQPELHKQFFFKNGILYIIYEDIFFIDNYNQSGNPVRKVAALTPTFLHGVHLFL